MAVGKAAGATCRLIAGGVDPTKGGQLTFTECDAEHATVRPLLALTEVQDHVQERLTLHMVFRLGSNAGLKPVADNVPDVVKEDVGSEKEGEKKRKRKRLMMTEEY